MRGTAPSGSVQLQDYCVRPEKNGELFFKSLSEFSSDPRRRAEAPVVTYSALSSSNRLHWVQMLVMNAPCIPRLNL